MSNKGELPTSPPGRVVGVDGCRAGWFAVWQDNEQIQFAVYADVVELYSSHQHASTILVDIPIGLTNGEPRNLESKMRSLLSSKSSSVFSVPCKDAVYARNYDQACGLNSRRFGKKISLQAWNICGKIREMDQFLRAEPMAQKVFAESHPELVFALLAGTLINTSKKKSAGVEERLKVLDRYDSRLRATNQLALRSYLRKQVARDDIVDAMALYIAAASVRQLEVKRQTGDGGIPIRLLIPSPSLFSPDLIC